MRVLNREGVVDSSWGCLITAKRLRHRSQGLANASTASVCLPLGWLTNRIVGRATRNAITRGHAEAEIVRGLFRPRQRTDPPQRFFLGRTVANPGLTDVTASP